MGYDEYREHLPLMLDEAYECLKTYYEMETLDPSNHFPHWEATIKNIEKFKKYWDWDGEGESSEQYIPRHTPNESEK